LDLVRNQKGWKERIGLIHTQYFMLLGTLRDMFGFVMHLVLDTYIIHTAHGSLCLNVVLVYEGGLYEVSVVWLNVRATLSHRTIEELRESFGLSASGTSKDGIP